MYMTIEKLDDNKILISLYKQDLNKLLLDNDKITMKNPDFKDAIKSILSLAICKANINTDNKKVIIEALPYDNGCFLLVTFIEAKSFPKKFRIKKPKTNIFVFKNVDDLINLSIQIVKNNINIPQNSLYEYNNIYCLATSKLDKTTENLIKEFAKKANKDYTDATKNIARLEEYGKTIAVGNALKTIGNAMIENKIKDN